MTWWGFMSIHPSMPSALGQTRLGAIERLDSALHFVDGNAVSLDGWARTRRLP
jgi:hypothetical protein